MNNLNEEQRKQLIAMFMSHGWTLLKAELESRSTMAARSIIFGQNRETDESNRGVIKTIDFIKSIERNLYAPPEQDEAPQKPAPTDRYMV